MIDVLGITGGLFAVIAFLFTKERPIRIVSSIAAVIFIAYGIFRGSLSIWLLNATLLGIHSIRLIKLHIENKKK